MNTQNLHPELHDYPTARLSVEHVSKVFPSNAGAVQALDDVSIGIN